LLLWHQVGTTKHPLFIIFLLFSLLLYRGYIVTLIKVLTICHR
jgi:hypothetical protein